MLKKLLLGGLFLVVAGLAMILGVYVVTGPEGPPSGSAAAVLLKPGPYDVDEVELTLVDDSRPTQANGEYPGADSRTLVTSVWFPEGPVEGGMPLVIYAHGFMSNRYGGDYLAKALASRGYVVASADFPLTNTAAPGGANGADVVEQPGDVSFIIDSVLGLEGADKPFEADIDPARVGVMGLSLGGLTSTLVGYHPRLRDARVRAVISIAGPAGMFTRGYFLNSRAPFLMIAGTEDAIVDYETHAAIIPGRVTQGTLLTIRGGAHTSFVSLAEPSMRFMDNPDSLGCDVLLAGGDDAPGDPFSVLGDLSDGVNPEATRLAICTRPLGKAMHPGRQHMITQAGVISFFTAQFAEDPEERRTAREYLRNGIGADFPEASTTF